MKAIPAKIPATVRNGVGRKPSAEMQEIFAVIEGLESGAEVELAELENSVKSTYHSLRKHAKNGIVSAEVHLREGTRLFVKKL